MYIKENRRLWDYCIKEKKMIYHRLLKDPIPFYGCCYANVCEYVLPILHQGRVIAALTVGGFKTDEGIIDYKLGQLANKYGLQPSKLYTTYQESNIEWRPGYEEQIEHLKLVVEYLALAYANLMDIEMDKIRHQKEMSRPYILSHVLEYIKLHYKEDITLEELARFCHCSKSYISHQFRLYTQMTLRHYVNQLRLNAAKELLMKGNPITEVAFMVGFKDSNYFSKVFRELEHITPTDYINQSRTS